MAKLADGPEIKIESQLVRSWDSIGLKDEAAMYKESGKQGVTLENLNRLKEGMSFDQAEVLLEIDIRQEARRMPHLSGKMMEYGMRK